MEVSYLNTKQLNRSRKVYKAIQLKQKLHRHMLKELYRLGNVKESDQVFLPQNKRAEYKKIYAVLNRPTLNEQARLLYIKKRKK